MCDKSYLTELASILCEASGESLRRIASDIGTNAARLGSNITGKNAMSVPMLEALLDYFGYELCVRKVRGDADEEPEIC